MSNLPANVDQNAIIRAIGGLGDAAKEGGRVAVFLITGNKFEIRTEKKSGGSFLLDLVMLIALFVYIMMQAPNA